MDIRTGKVAFRNFTNTPNQPPQQANQPVSFEPCFEGEGPIEVCPSLLGITVLGGVHNYNVGITVGKITNEGFDLEVGGSGGGSGFAGVDVSWIAIKKPKPAEEQS